MAEKEQTDPRRRKWDEVVAKYDQKDGTRDGTVPEINDPALEELKVQLKAAKEGTLTLAFGSNPKDVDFQRIEKEMKGKTFTQLLESKNPQLKKAAVWVGGDVAEAYEKEQQAKAREAALTQEVREAIAGVISKVPEQQGNYRGYHMTSLRGQVDAPGF